MKIIYNLPNYLFKQMSFGNTALYKQSGKREDSSYRDIVHLIFFFKFCSWNLVPCVF